MITQNTSPVYVNRVRQDWMANGGVYGDGGVYYQSASNTPTLNFQFAGATDISSQITFTRATNASYFNSAGVLTNAAANAPRLDYNPSTLAAQGLLIEESRANLCFQSEDFSTTWTVAGTATITTNQLTSPAGTLTADLLTAPTGGPNRVQQLGTAVVSTSYAASVFVKAGNINGVTLRVLYSGGTTIDTYADFIFSSATFSGVAGAGVFSAQNCGNGWYRITCVIASGNNTAWDFRIGGLITTAQTGTTAYVWGAQLEAGAFPTSYIPTTTTALTRAADVASVNTLSPWYNATEGTLYAEVGSAPVNTLVQVAYELNDNLGGGAGRLFTRRSSAGTIGSAVIDGSVTQADIASGVVIAGSAVYKVAFAFAANNFANSLNGAAVITDTAGTMPSTIAKLFLGQNYGATQVLNGYLRRITYYPRRLSNAELQTLTT
jgi:hypothetical protein